MSMVSVVCGRKFCRGCGRWRLIVDFPVRQREPSLILAGRCHHCTLIYQRTWRAEHPERQREYSRAYLDRLTDERREHRREARRRYESGAWQDPERREKLRAKNREQYLKVRNDPERWAQRLEYQRMGKRLTEERNGHPRPPVSEALYLRRYGDGYGRQDGLPADPLRNLVEDWIDDAIEGSGYELLGHHTTQRLVRMTGVSDRTIRRLLDGQPTIGLRQADKICAAIGVPLALLYPDGA